MNKEIGFVYWDREEKLFVDAGEKPCSAYALTHENRFCCGMTQWPTSDQHLARLEVLYKAISMQKRRVKGTNEVRYIYEGDVIPNRNGELGVLLFCYGSMRWYHITAEHERKKGWWSDDVFRKSIGVDIEGNVFQTPDAWPQVNCTHHLYCEVYGATLKRRQITARIDKAQAELELAKVELRELGSGA